MLKRISLFILFSLAALSAAKFPFLKSENLAVNHYAVLVAGSNGFWNYRHQSDIFHAYHLLIDNGMPKENIIVFAYDDIANDSQNPFPGQVYNKPDPDGKGKDVYEGVTIDYKGGDVTPANFLAVLEGKEIQAGSKRVLQTGEKDNIFVYFSDHGATGLIAFPSEELYADALNTTLQNMSDNKRFNEFVFYLEACESGSMFNKILPENIKIYATTAANPNQSSWATYCSPDDRVDGKSIGSCLGDEYSVNWLEDSDSDDGLKKTLQSQFENVKGKTKGSEVHQYGDLSFKDKDIGQYQGNHVDKNFFKKFVDYIMSIIHKIFGEEKKPVKKESEEYKAYLAAAKKSKVDSREAKLHYLYEKVQRLDDEASNNQYTAELKHMTRADYYFNYFNQYFNIKSDQVVSEIKFDCLKPAVETYKKICQWGEYDLKYVRNIAKACEQNASIDEIAKLFEKICSN